MTEYWRDLEIGEQKKVGDRFFDDGEWVLMRDAHLELEFARVYSAYSKPTQRRVVIQIGDA